MVSIFKRGTGERARTIVVSHYSASPGGWSNLRLKTSSADSLPVVELCTSSLTSKDYWRGPTREFAQLVDMWFVDLEKAFNRVLLGFLWGVLREYGVPDSLQRAIWSLYACNKSCVSILGIKSDTFPVGGGLRQGCPFCGFH